MMTGGDILSNDLKEQYFNWLYDHVVESKYPYRRLLNRLHEIPFTFILPMDENRMEDGLNLRYRFGLEAGIPQVEIVNKLDISECSVLEMMAALAIRCEENIMNDPEAGDQTARWFMEMLSNLELSCMDDDHYDQSYVDHRVDIFLHRRYASDGRGGLFHLEHCTDDLRNVQIWYQMNWYLNEIMGF